MGSVELHKHGGESDHDQREGTDASRVLWDKALKASEKGVSKKKARQATSVFRTASLGEPIKNGSQCVLAPSQ